MLLLASLPGPVTPATFPWIAPGHGRPGKASGGHPKRLDRASAAARGPEVRLSLEPPILDLRDRQASRRLGSGRLLTLGLWVGSAWLMGAPVTVGLAFLALPVLLLPRRGVPGPFVGRDADAPQEDLPRQALAEVFGLDESTLFRARHARSNTLHYNEQGEIVAIDSREVGVSMRVVGPRLQSGRHAHPVG